MQSEYPSTPIYYSYVSIYALLDNDGKPFYVGCSCDVEKRIKQHKMVSKSAPYIMIDLYKKIASLNYVFEYKILQTVFVSAAKKRLLTRKCASIEYEWINKFRKDGFEMLNLLPYNGKRKNTKSRILIPRR